MAIHWRTPYTADEWLDIPEPARPHNVMAFQDDAWIMQILAERIVPAGPERFYEIELEALD